MPNYQTGTLLASGGDVYTQLMTVLDTYLTARGWTVNLFGDYRWRYAGDEYTGKRIHAQKTIDSIDRFINLRSFKNQRVFAWTGYDIKSGLAATLSTGFTAATHTVALTSVSDLGGGDIRLSAAGIYGSVGDTVTVAGTTDYNGNHTVIVGGGNSVEVTATYVSSQSGTLEGPSRWDRMTGWPGVSNPNVQDSNGSAGCLAAQLSEDVLTYFLFSENSGDNIYLVCNNSQGYTGFCFGTTSEGNYFLSGSSHEDPGTVDDNLLLCWVAAIGVFLLRKKDDTEWWDWPSSSPFDEVVIPYNNNINTSHSTGVSIVQQLLFCSPDNFKGNNPLIPAYIATNYWTFAGVIPGVKYVNMKFMDSLTELTFGGDVYKLFRLYGIDDANDATLGLAFLK